VGEGEWMGEWGVMVMERDGMKGVTAEDVGRVAKTYLKPSNRTIGKFVPADKPDRSEIPATPDVAALVKDYKGNAAVELGEAFEATPANIDSRTVRVTLPNGMKLALLPKKTRGATVTAALTIHYGDEKSLANRDAAAQLTAPMLMRGTQKHNRQQLQDELDKLKAQMSTGGTSITGASLSISTVRAGFSGVLKLAAEVLREP